MPAAAPATRQLVLLASLLLATATTRAAICQKTGEAPAIRKPIPALRSAFRKHKKPEEVQARREACLDAVLDLDSGPLAKALIQAYRKLEAECGPAEQKRHPILLSDRGERLQRLRDEIQPLHSLQERILDKLRRLESAAAREVLAQMFYQKQLPLRLRTIGARSAARLLRPAQQRPGGEAQSFLFLRAVASLERAGSIFAPQVLALLDHEDEALRVEALDTLAALGAPSSLEPLVAFLERDVEFRLKTRAGETLAKLTGFELGANPSSWRAWLQKEGQPYQNGDKRLGGHELQAGARDQGRYYFGIPLDRRSIVFVHDNSLSMRQKLRGPDVDDKTRLQRSLAELEKALDTLQASQRFNIVLFANRVWSFETKQVRANAKNIQRAKDWLRYQKLELGTCIYNALDAAFVLGGRGVRDRYYRSEVDAIYLLSDGAPTPFLSGRRGAGATRSPEKAIWIRQAVKRWNPFHRVQVHTILLGGGPRSGARNFMKRLAEENRGSFVHIGGRR